MDLPDFKAQRQRSAPFIRWALRDYLGERRRTALACHIVRNAAKKQCKSSSSRVSLIAWRSRVGEDQAVATTFGAQRGHKAVSNVDNQPPTLAARDIV
ncbi:hypothetical protein [Micromonospora zamorensis]|uniref:hypothetical protein n=1 Tax=Micromonospora zamorensis TaxID=709883 RepID=UPI0033CDCD98